MYLNVFSCYSKEHQINAKINGFFHISKGEHICLACYDKIGRFGRPIYERYVEWKNVWVSESRCAPFLRLFILDQLLPYWLNCLKCGKFRVIERNKIEICFKSIKNFCCSQIFSDVEEACKIDEERVNLFLIFLTF